MALITPAFIPVHIPGGDDPDAITPDGESKEKKPARIGMPKNEKT
jgi:hypothetical protein